MAGPSQLLYGEVAGTASAVQLHFEMSASIPCLVWLRHNGMSRSDEMPERDFTTLHS